MRPVIISQSRSNRKSDGINYECLKDWQTFTSLSRFLPCCHETSPSEAPTTSDTVPRLRCLLREEQKTESMLPAKREWFLTSTVATIPILNPIRKSVFVTAASSLMRKATCEQESGRGRGEVLVPEKCVPTSRQPYFPSSFKNTYFAGNSAG